MSNNTLLPAPYDDSPRVRPENPITSHEAADSNNVLESQTYVLQLLRARGPLADFELIALGGLWSDSRMRTARNELTEQKRVADTGIYRLTQFKRRAKVWQAIG